MRRLAPTWLAVVAGALFVVSCSDSSTPTQPLTSNQPSLQEFVNQGTSARIHVMPTRAIAALNEAKGGSHGGGGKPKTSTSTGINYHGGPIIQNTKVVAIYWGTSRIYNGGPNPGTAGSGTSDGSLVGYFLRNLGASAYFNINTTYYDGNGNYVNPSVDYASFWADNSAPGSSVSDSKIQAEVVKGFTSGAYSYDPNTLYAVFSGSGVNLGGGFGTQYCAYHGYFTYNGNVVKYAAMPYVADYPSGCNVQSTTPNGDFAADGVINVLAHETEETTTDPHLNAWYDRRGYENADKCAWKFGTVYTVSNGSYANMKIGSLDFLIQMNWVNAGSGGCLQGY